MENKVIYLRAYEPEKNPEVVCRPVQDETGQTYTGQGELGYFESLTEEEKRKLGYVVNPETSLKITNGFVINLTYQRDATNWKWLQKHPYITEKKLEQKPNDAAFYIYDGAEEAKIVVNREKRRTEIMSKIFAKSEEDIRNLASALGLGDNTGLSPDEVLSWIKNLVDAKPNSVEPLLEDRATVTVKQLLVEAQNKSVISKSRGWLKFEEVNLGNGEDNAIEFLKNPENEEIVLAIRARMEEVQ